MGAPAVPVGYAPAPAPYAPGPAPYHAPAPYHEEKVPPKPFAYEYGGADEYGRHFAKTETQDEYGVVQGDFCWRVATTELQWPYFCQCSMNIVHILRHIELF